MMKAINSKINGTVLYIGGFELPDKNAAAQRVLGIAKSLRDIGYKVIFINAIKNCQEKKYEIKNYYGFQTVEYNREDSFDYLVGAFTAINHIKEIQPDIVIAYNYPAKSLERINNYCQKKKIKCIADVTEWYDAKSGNIIHRVIKKLDTEYRMRIVHNKMNGIIAISRYLYEYYNNKVNTVIIPPTVDINDSKWNTSVAKNNDCITFVYAGSPTAEKEELDLIVKEIENLSKFESVKLNIVGITKEQFIKMYSWKTRISDAIVFWGRMDHEKAIDMVKKADCSIILRKNSRVVKAGFPTKLVESISCNTPVIANNFSNITDYMNNKNGLVINKINDLYNVIHNIKNKKIRIDRDTFDYHQYISIIKQVL